MKTLLLLLLLLLVVGGCSADRVTFLNTTKMPRADSLNLKEGAPPGPPRGLTIHPVYLAHDSSGRPLDDPDLPASTVTLVHKLVEDAAGFFKAALRLNSPVSQDGILLSKSCEYKPGTGTMFADNAPVQPACPKRCSHQTMCGPLVVVPEAMQRYCTDMEVKAMVLNVEDYIGDYYDPEYIDADFVLFVNIATRDNSACDAASGTLDMAESSFCQQDLTTYRPLAGYITFCPGYPGLTAGNYGLLLPRVKHQLTHMLGFSLNALGLSPSLNQFSYGDYSESNQPRLPEERLVSGPDYWFYLPVQSVLETRESETRPGVHVTSYLFKTPKVLEVARAYFGCPSLGSLELDNSGHFPYTAGSHWTSRLLPEELMAAGGGGERLSAFTLAYLEDTGWYKADYSVAEELTFGRGAGCEFMELGCEQLMEQFPEWFCNREHSICNARRTTIRSCSIRMHEQDLPELYRHFSDPRLGGLPHMDYCPAYLESERCRPDQACLDVSWHPGCESQPAATCLDIHCADESYSAPSLGVTCTYEGESIALSTSDECGGVLVCPSCETVCDSCDNFPRHVTTQTPTTTLVPTTTYPIPDPTTDTPQVEMQISGSEPMSTLALSCAIVYYFM